MMIEFGSLVTMLTYVNHYAFPLVESCRQEIYDDAQAQVERANGEKELWEQKYEQKRKALKELETSLGQKNSELEKQATLLKSALQKVEGEKAA